MINPEGKKPLQSFQSQPKYELSIAIYNKKTGTWEPGSSYIVEKATQFVEESGIFNLIAQSQSGDLLEITESGIYKKRDATWVKELTKNEMNEKFPKVGRVISRLDFWRSMSTPEETSLVKKEVVSPSFVSDVMEKESVKEGSMIVEVRIVDKTLPDVKDLTEKLKETHPQLADSITVHSNLQKTLQKKHAVLMQQEKIDPQQHEELLNSIEVNDLFLGHLIETGHTALYGENRVNSLEIPAIKKIAMGKAKEVFERKGLPQYVYYTPINSIFKTKENELKQELKTAKQITSNLFGSDLIDLFKKNQLSQPEKISHSLLAKYKTPEELVGFLAKEGVQGLVKKFSITLDEAEKIVNLSTTIAELGAKENNLMIDLQVIEGEEKIEGKYTVRTLRAANDLEKEIQNNPSFTTKIKFVSSFFNGMENMHKSGHVHGDLKPENLLVYEDMSKNEKGRPAKLVKISDFGKTRSLKEKERVMYTGNPRFSPPEKKLSRQGEVYSSALIAIRILEEGLLNPTNMMLIEPAKKGSEIQPHHDRRGIEKYAILSESMTQTESSSLKGKVRAYGPQLLSPPVDLDQAEIEIHAYIDVLTNTLEIIGSVPEQKILPLNLLLKEMTLSNPEKRPNMAEVNRRFNEIGLP